MILSNSQGASPRIQKGSKAVHTNAINWMNDNKSLKRVFLFVLSVCLLLAQLGWPEGEIILARNSAPLNKIQFLPQLNRTKQVLNISTSECVVAESELLPSDSCISADVFSHPLEATLQQPKLSCEDSQFTSITINGNQRRVELHDCAVDASWGNSLNAAGKNSGGNGKFETIAADNGIDIVYSLCAGKTNLRVYPYRLPQSKLSLREEGPSVLVFFLESTSLKRFEMDFPLTDSLLGGRKMDYQVYNRHSVRFPYTSVMGKNTIPNMKRIINGNSRESTWWDSMWRTILRVTPPPQNIFRIARAHQLVTSVWDDYCPVHGLCELYPFDEHRVCDNLLCNYKNYIVDLYDNNTVPGCAHGEWWINQQIRYIDALWTDAYPKERIFYLGKHYSCHMERLHRSVCKSNDKDLSSFLSRFLKNHPETALILAGDHGFHWTRKGKYNNYAVGESEHRRPLLHMVLPKSATKQHINHARVNAARFVTHDDLHATMLGLILGKATASLARTCAHHADCSGFDLLGTLLPEKRSCKSAKIPSGWCACLMASQEKPCHADCQQGQVCELSTESGKAQGV